MKKGEAVKYNKPLVTDKRKQTQIKLDILWEGKKARRDETILKVLSQKTWSNATTKTFLIT